MYYTDSYNSNSGVQVWQVWAICFAVAALLIGFPIARLASSVVEVIEVEETYTKIQSENNRYMVNVEGETLVNRDRLIFGKYDSSDIQRELDEGQCYEVLIEGWRVPFLSWYRNIVEVRREVDCG